MKRIWAGLFVAVAVQAGAQAAAKGIVREVAVRGASLEGNLVGAALYRTVAVYLPPSYEGSSKRYPVLYVLHGIMDTHRAWTEPWGPPSPPNPGYSTIQELMDRGVSAGTLNEMIVVIPSADQTCHYTDSPVKGGWGSFIARDLVRFIDSHYRTAAGSSGRGILGHSMGGHGAIKLAMTHPGVFGAVFAMNPSLLGWGGDVSLENPNLVAAARLRRPDEVAQANFYTQAVIGIGQCFSPDRNAPLLTEVPFTFDALGQARVGPAYDRWSAQMPTFMARSKANELKALRALHFETAHTDEFTHIPPTTKALHALLDSLGVPHTFETYDGDHRNRLWGADGRLATVAMPFFSRMLSAEAASVTVAGLPAPPLASAAPTGPPAPPTRAQIRLWEAAISGKLKDAESALKGGADVNALDTRTNQNGRRALNHAAERNRADLIRWLVKNGADVNGTNRTGFTALHHAAEVGSLAATEALLALGADPKIALPSGATPLRIARQRGKSDVAALLEKATTP